MPTIYSPSSIPLRIPFAPNRRFNFTKPIHIRNRTTKLTNYQIEVDLNTSNFAFEKAQPNGADIRFQDTNGKSLSYWIESWTSTTAKIWVKLDEIEAYEDRIIWLIYGNYNAVSESNGDNAFVFFDDFSSAALDSDKWDTSLASDKFSQSGGNLVVSGADANSYYLYTKNTIGENVNLEYKFKRLGGFFTFGVYRNRAQNAASIGHVKYINYESAVGKAYDTTFPLPERSYTAAGVDGTMIGDGDADTWYRISLEIYSNSIRAVKDGTNYDYIYSALNEGKPGFSIYCHADNDNLNIDFFFARKNSAIEPLVEVL